MHKSATKCNETIDKWCKNKHGASKIIDTFETYQTSYLVTAQHRLGPGASPAGLLPLWEEVIVFFSQRKQLRGQPDAARFTAYRCSAKIDAAAHAGYKEVVRRRE
jgi:hypothetical protein